MTTLRSRLRPGEMSRQQVLDYFGWTDDDLNQARGFACFPAPMLRTFDSGGGFIQIPVWREEKVATWLGTVKTLLRSV